MDYLYDETLLLHSEGPRGKIEEKPDRIRVIHTHLEDLGLLRDCRRVGVTRADVDSLRRVHSESYIERLIDLKLDYSDMMNPKPRRPGVKYQMGRSLYDNEHTSDCIFLAAGAAVNAVNEVWNGPSQYSFANIRPPGHHASHCQAEGFCYVNNVAVAAAFAKQVLGASRILIVDFDVHHGNGTQDIFEADRDVLYISLHRHDNANFYPYYAKAAGSFIGTGAGLGFNVNVAWDTTTCSKGEA
mmetsp:Transcript_27538/g.49660  ORF Transcript_27538/g.49660 Transcript_27538/m.49660 type:complete len:242 (-) Transcript_27538:486-1211(-)